ncbi:Sodium:dicarboxylate symporter [Obelidium mucronatum]|nr:Sodium:dicarboxylate symporter [Obelidium mucronatum]
MHPATTQVETRDSRPLWKKVLGSVTFWLFLATIAGCVLGSAAPKFSVDAAPTANLFMRPIQFVVFPLVFSSLVAAIAGHSDLKKLGKLALKTFIYFEVVTTLALIFGLVAVNVVKPGGDGISQGKNPNITSTDTFTYALWINHLTPKTWGEMMGGSGSSELLQVLTASILFGCASSLVPNAHHKQTILAMCNAVLAVMFKFVDIIIWFAPIAVMFSIAAVVGKAGGLSVLATLGKLVATLYGTCLIFILVIFGIVCLIFKIHPLELVVAMKEPLIIAYTTATSEAALPKVFEALEEYGVSTEITAFVVPFGYSFNLDGSTLYLSLAAVFCAQASGVTKTIGEQIIMVLMLMISSKGVAGVRSASIIVLAATLAQFDIPQWPIGIILGVDWFMDMARTFTNVLGNCLAAVAMAKWEGEFRKEVLIVSSTGSEQTQITDAPEAKIDDFVVAN